MLFQTKIPKKLCKNTFSQTKCCSIISRRPLMCEGILVGQHAIKVKLLNIIPIKNSPKLCKSMFFQSKCLSIISRVKLMCEVSFVALHLTEVKLLNNYLLFLFGIDICRRSLRSDLVSAARRDQCNSYKRYYTENGSV